MEKKIYDLIDSYAEEFATHLSRWIRVPSVKDEPAPGAPFGAECRRMYDMALEDCRAEGFVVRGFDGFTVVLESEGKQQLIYKHAISTVVTPRAVELCADT